MLVRLSEKQDRPLLNCSRSNVLIMNNVEQPKFVLDVLSLGPKQPIRDITNEAFLGRGGDCNYF